MNGKVILLGSNILDNSNGLIVEVLIVILATEVFPSREIQTSHLFLNQNFTKYSLIPNKNV